MSDNYGYTPNNPQGTPAPQGQPTQPNFNAQPQQPGFPQNPGYAQQPGFAHQPGAGNYDAYGNPIPNDARTMAVLAHLSSLAGLFFTATFMNFVGPLIFWLIYKDKPGYAFVTHAAAGAFNFSFTVWVINIVAWIFTFVTFGFGVFISAPVIAVVSIASIVFNIIAATKAHAGEVYNYPMTIRVLK